MDSVRFGKIRDGFLKRVAETLEVKGQDYSNVLGEEEAKDALWNFKAIGQLMNLDPVTVWGVLFGKHAVAVLGYAGGKPLVAESVEDKLRDLAAYSLLGYALLVEEGSLPDIGLSGQEGGQEEKKDADFPSTAWFQSLLDGFRERVNAEAQTGRAKEEKEAK